MYSVKYIDVTYKMNGMPRPFFLLLLFVFLQRPMLRAQTSITPSPGILDGYIHTGLDSNLALRQRNFDLQRARLDLQRARSLFYPQAGFSSQYTLADGGRTQSIPVGDLLNSVYSTLNQLTGSNRFPQVANQSVQFLPNDFQDTKMEISLPLLNPDLNHNRQVSGELINARQADVDIYRRELVRNIRQAYYQYLQAGKAVEIYHNALELVKENRRVSEKFVENRMATKEIVLRAQAQVSQVEVLPDRARQRTWTSATPPRYFNFLLNRLPGCAGRRRDGPNGRSCPQPSTFPRKSPPFPPSPPARS